MDVERCVVDDRVLLLGLDALYRTAVKPHEAGELLECARAVSAALGVLPAVVPVEGHYAESQALSEYFMRFRALQQEGRGRRSEVASLAAFQRLLEVVASPLYGFPALDDALLPAGRDALSQALLDTRPAWELGALVARAREVARDRDECSLVGLAAWVGDPVLLTALRESVVLYAEPVALGLPPQRQYVWRVDERLEQRAGRFVETFNGLFEEALPAPEPRHADVYWEAFEANAVAGRCACLGYDDATAPTRHYHWGLYTRDAGQFAVQEFWAPEPWTTSRYRSGLPPRGEHPGL